MSETVPIWQRHDIVRIKRQDGELVEGCVCQVADNSVDIEEGEISHLADKDDDCPHQGTRFP